MSDETVKAAVRERDCYRCKLCGMTNRQHEATFGKCLEVHRSSPGSAYTLDGCVTLCRVCHDLQPISARGGGPLKNGAVTLELGPDLFAALDAYLTVRRPRVKRTALIRWLVETHLAEHGHWPPK